MTRPGDVASGHYGAQRGGTRSSSSTALVVCAGAATFVTALDNTVVNVALPVIARDLALATDDLEWIASSYILTFAGLMLAGGKLADRFGRRRMFRVGLTVFGVSSLLTGLAPNLAVLVSMRAAQGAGAALLLPALLAILAADASERQRHLGVGVATAAAAVALALGPLVGGAIAQYWHWSWIFFINVPVVALTWYFGRGIPSKPPADPLGGLDLPGLGTSALSLTAFTWALIESAPQGWGSPAILAALLVALAGGAAFVATQLRGDSPMIRVELLRNRRFLGASFSQFLWGLALNGVFFFTSLFLQEILGLSPTLAGASFIPLALALVALVPFVGAVVARLGVGLTIAVGLVLVAAGLLWAARVGIGAGVVELMPAMLLIGAGSALGVPMTSAALGMVPEQMAGMASSVLTVAKEVAGVFGIVLTGAVLAARRGQLQAAGVPAPEAFVGGYHAGLVVGAALTLLGAVVAYRTLRQ